MTDKITSATQAEVLGAVAFLVRLLPDTAISARVGTEAARIMVRTTNDVDLIAEQLEVAATYRLRHSRDWPWTYTAESDLGGLKVEVFCLLRSIDREPVRAATTAGSLA